MIAPAAHRARDPHRMVVALGGNALHPEGERGDAHQQFAHTRESMGALVQFAATGWRLAIVHGNGPQIGDELLRNERTHDEVPSLPLGMLVAATAGWIGYMVQQSLQNALAGAGVDRPIATLITQVVVDPAEARGRPTKPIGRSLDEEQARALEHETDWVLKRIGERWRRVVPSPLPQRIVEAPQVERLVADGAIVIAAGGGGTPVQSDEAGCLDGVDAVVDKDRAAEVLGRQIGAAVLLILTNVDGVYRAYGTAQQELLTTLRVADAETMLAEGEFGEGSMAPKVEAAVAFVRHGGTRAIIARLDQGLQAVDGDAGTTITA